MARKKFKFPKELLEKINECSFGGFILFNFDEEGEFQTFGMFDSKIYAQALERNLITTIKAIEKIQIETAAKALDSEEEGLDGDGSDFKD